MKVGFIGLGIMGSRMAGNLIKKGHELVLFNRTRKKAGPLVAGRVFLETRRRSQRMCLSLLQCSPSLLRCQGLPLERTVFLIICREALYGSTPVLLIHLFHGQWPMNARKEICAFWTHRLRAPRSRRNRRSLSFTQAAKKGMVEFQYPPP